MLGPAKLACTEDGTAGGVGIIVAFPIRPTGLQLEARLAEGDGDVGVEVGLLEPLIRHPVLFLFPGAAEEVRGPS